MSSADYWYDSMVETTNRKLFAELGDVDEHTSITDRSSSFGSLSTNARYNQKLRLIREYEHTYGPMPDSWPALLGDYDLGRINAVIRWCTPFYTKVVPFKTFDYKTLEADPLRILLFLDKNGHVMKTPVRSNPY